MNNLDKQYTDLLQDILDNKRKYIKLIEDSINKAFNVSYLSINYLKDLKK